MTAGTGPRSGSALDGAAGLVPSKTTFCAPSTFVSSHPSEVVLRRLARLRRNVIAAAQLHGLADRGQRPARPWFVTLTYAPGVAWRAEHVSKAIKAFRYWCEARGVPCRYEWVAELQARGAVHYHLIAWLPSRLSMPKWDTHRNKHGVIWWPHGMSNRQRCKSGAGYLAKYLSKMGEFARFPKGCRLYGIGGLSGDGRGIRAWWNLPEWCRRMYGVGDVVRRAGALVVRATLEVLAPRFSLRRVHGGFQLRQLVPLAERFHAGAFSTFPRPASALAA